MPRLHLAALLLAGASTAQARELRDYCPDRPGLGSPACTIDKGHVSLEVGLADWTLDKTAGARNSQITGAQILARYGVGDATELQLGWDGYGRERFRDAAGRVTHDHGAGDLTVALRQNLRNPDGSGLSIALTPYTTLPVGRAPLGAGDWSAGLTGAVSIELNDVFALALTPEIAAAVDEDRHGRHLAYGSVEGISAKLGKTVTVAAEYQTLRDRDPGGHETMQLVGLSLGWQPRDDLQLDVGANKGVRHAADVELYVGMSRRF